jgi:hypothetical protein
MANDPREQDGLPPLAPDLGTGNDDDGGNIPTGKRGPGRPRNGSIPPEDNSEEEALINLLRNDADTVDAKIEIQRRVGNRYAWIDSMPITDWDSGETKQRLAARFGGGDFRARVRRSDGTQAKQFTFTIDHSIQPTPAQPAESQLARRNDSENTIMALMQQQQDTQMKFMQMLNAQQAESSRQMMQLMVTAMGAKQAAPVAPVGGFNDRIMELLLTRALAPAPAPDIMGIIKTLSSIRRDDESARGGDDEGGGGDGIFDTILKALPQVLPGLLSAVQAQQQPQAPARAIAPRPPRPQAPGTPQPAAAPVAPAAPAAVPASEDTVELDDPQQAPPINKAALALFMPQLVELASKEASPVDSAAAIRGALTPDQNAELAALLNTDTWLATLIDANQQVMKYTRWFGALRDALLGEAVQ